MAVTVWFYNPEAEWVTGTNLVNKLVAGLYPPFCHTELQFPNGEACSIVMHDSVRMRVRTFDEAFYTGLVLSAPPQALNAAMALARRHVHAGTPFGVGAARTFCSKLVAELLVSSGLVSEEELPPAVVTPSALYQHLARCAACCGVRARGGLVAHPPVSVSAPALAPVGLGARVTSAWRLPGGTAERKARIAPEARRLLAPT